MKKKDASTIDENIIVDARNIGMSFKVPTIKYDTLKEQAIGYLRGKRNYSNKFTVLDNISFQIKKGESLGVIGHNGAGKSTLLKIVSGIFPPTKGEIKTRGQIVLLNLGSGFDMEANAIENIYLNGAICGFSRKQMKERFDSIVKFAELEDFLTLPLKNYSSGMISRLGFAIAIDVCPDLLLVDEVLSVGDVNFQNKCRDKIKELQAKGTSIMFVSHSVSAIEDFCQKTIWIEDSKVKAYGDSKAVCGEYLAYCADANNRKIPAPILDAVICTYKREKYVLNNIERLKQCKDCISHVFVVDNGNTLPTNISDDFVTIVPNKNLGGTGGFTRGLIEAKKTLCSHVLLMDDDIEFKPETFRLAYEQINNFKKEEQRDWIGFAMRNMDRPNIQHEMGAQWNTFKIIHNNHNLDLSIAKNLKKNEIHQHYNYSAWWSLIMPISVVDDYGYPFPFFIKFDDIEYGLRRDGEIIHFGNDFYILHEPFSLKQSAWLEYYSVRNAFITNVLHYHISRISSCIRYSGKIIKNLFKGKTDVLVMTNKAVNDFLKGSAPFFELDMEEQNKLIKEEAASITKSTSRSLKEAFKSIKISFRLFFYYSRVSKDFKTAFPQLTSLEYWNDALELSNKEHSEENTK